MAKYLMHTESIQLEPAGRRHVLRRARLPKVWLLRSAFIRWIASQGAAILASYWLLDADQGSPWIWLALVWIAALAVSAYYFRNTFIRILCINLAAVLFAFGIGEIWFGLVPGQAPQQSYSGDYTGHYFVDHPLLGYGPKSAYVATAGLTVNGRQIYDTSYSINPAGLRITPEAPGANSSALFFGGSFTFGEGVSDAQSMPYRVGEMIGPASQVYNFGFHGYGPHQMLAALEFGLVESIVTQPVRTVVYQAIDSHVQRAAGRAFWDLSGPRYILTDTGQAEFAGHFDEGHGAFRKWILERLNKSHLHQRIYGVYSAVSDADVSLYGAIVDRSRDLLKARNPSSEFHVLLWGFPDSETFISLRDALTERGLIVHPVSDILPEYELNLNHYQLDADDTHPNALAHEIIARYVTDHIIAGSED